MGFRYTSIRQSQIKHCRTCNAEIFWVQNRNGKWFAVDVTYHPGIRGPVYKHNGGAYSNLTPWHKCLPQRDLAGEELVKQAQRLALAIATKALHLYRAQPEANQDRLKKVQMHAQARIQRRIARLPEGSR